MSRAGRGPIRIGWGLHQLQPSLPDSDSDSDSDSAYSQFDFTNAVSFPRISDTIAVAVAAPAAAAATAAFRHDGCIPAALQPAKAAAFWLHSDG